ncbi:YdiU family protein [Chryseobacterium suipulveris]|uniref:Protein nucleotidyltransferase YdiU n=1 Tax=Chryseobacterium suipulveris TaxID=2929800 RepID=A0ABY4BTC4_9FLAO|nr:YdiU family protein [Chryseobacterium suipulveris]UOE41086.1 YdiU family protein [Chryseobacterium suipulveris]
MNLHKITQQYLTTFPGDFSGNPMQRQTPKVLFATTEIVGFQNPEIIIFNEKLSEEIGLGKIESDEDLKFINAEAIPKNIKTYATAYAGHQFGNWAGQLGDGRAIFAGEIENTDGKKTEIQWKGAGATPYSRHADGRAVLRSSVREYLISEAIYHLGIPTTRALSLSLTGEYVVRDIMYDGNPAYEKGAVMMRTAESFLRFGHFELLAAQNEIDTLRQLTDFTIKNYFPEIDGDSEDKYLLLFKEISRRTADLMVEWYRVGFVHGVMNTDNMSVLGLTIDYGPFSFVDEYDLNFTPNTTDLPGRRYAFGNQGKIAQWNLWQLANALYPLIKDEKKLEEILNEFPDYFWKKHDEMWAKKLGFSEILEGDEIFFSDMQKVLGDLKADHTLFFNRLEELENNADLKTLFGDIFYTDPNDNQWVSFEQIIKKYLTRLEKNTISKAEFRKLMSGTNPKFILRNYLLFECIEELNKGKKDLLNKILLALENPYEELFPEFSQKRPSKYDGQTGCSMLSCSS